MSSMRIAITALLFFLPAIADWVLIYRLSAYRRDGQGMAGTLVTSKLKLLRPDTYTDEAQSLLRWAWALLLITIPWCVAVALILG